MSQYLVTEGVISHVVGDMFSGAILIATSMYCTRRKTVPLLLFHKDYVILQSYTEWAFI